ncbi:MAG: hypothetical protein HY895_10985, partial [Deltaproteobacteria bacterium]|nr:hypothetical protein [Deltaproteobacteria bacterium]
VVHDSPIGIVGPKGMTPERVKVLHDAFQKALSDPAFLKAMASYEMPVPGYSLVRCSNVIMRTTPC